ncbi:MAG: PrgI family protein [Candidatus Moranbacteria bacterium]|nr:PrgI family protein [Candidatus Moranbacteria bacterium]
MMFNVPQFIDVEDKIAGPLTAKQLFWMIGMFAAIMVVVFFFPGPVTYVIAVPIVIVFALLAFYRPGGQPLISYVVHGFFFLFRPKLLIWNRPKAAPVRTVEKRQEQKDTARTRAVSGEEIRRMAEMMDRR